MFQRYFSNNLMARHQLLLTYLFILFIVYLNRDRYKKT